MKPEILTEARIQVGKYIAEIMKQRQINKVDLSEKAGINRQQLDFVLNGNREYTIDTFLKVITALDCYFFLADKEGQHLNFEHMQKKANPDKSMNFD